MFVRKMLARALPLTALGLAAWCPAYAVEEPVKADDVYVTATRVEKELQDVPMSVSVMTSEDIKRSPARTIGASFCRTCRAWKSGIPAGRALSAYPSAARIPTAC